jgi:hypothetical protein
MRRVLRIQVFSHVTSEKKDGIGGSSTEYGVEILGYTNAHEIAAIDSRLPFNGGTLSQKIRF